ncbi:stalk domain-containing protein [Brevibacillus sp. MCWH]|jgi:hypothetical protein|uniref:stalk domain-containing protein n=1 Tax=Brevibacillus sp. MCWH TaxID=2508871 RepID=UPI001490CA18|nr:stalk domain-containing protein [Brevibacillus sp. MCWH]NNV01648.1 hypothetical protein [Brevibacillus sp. MCWH]
MRRMINLFLVVLLLLVYSISTVYAADSSTPKVLVNGKEIGFYPQEPIKEGNTVLMDAGPILSSFSIYDAFFQGRFKDKWEKGDRAGLYKLENGTMVGVSREGKTFQITANQNYYIFEGQQINLDVAPRMVGDKLFIPVSLVRSMFSYRDYLVEYNAGLNIVAIYHKSLKNPFQEVSWNSSPNPQYTTTKPTNNVQQQESQKVIEFKKEISSYLGKNIFYRNGLVYDTSGNISSIENLTPFWITKVEEKSDSVLYNYRIWLISGKYTYYMDVEDALDFRMSFLDFNPYTYYKWSQKVWDHVKKGSVFVGMNKDMVSLSLGTPTRKNISTYSWGTFEQWVYDYKTFGTSYLYFKNGILTSWQQVK